MTDGPEAGLEILGEWDLGEVTAWASAGGTAGRTWKVTTGTAEYFLRRRGPRTSSEARVRFDCGLRDHLLACGVDTAAALATRSGARWVRRAEGVYELYPFVRGRPFDPLAPRDLPLAAEALARYHLAAARFRPPAAGEPIAQYTTLGFSARTSARMDDPELQLENLRAVAGLAPSPGEADLVARCAARVEAGRATYAGAAYDHLSGWVIHGDYTPANLLYAQGADAEDAGAATGTVYVFDLDWALPGARVRDVADGMYFFATRPRDLDAASIWSLTDAADFDPDRCARFLSAYAAVAPLSSAEVAAVPAAFAGRWLSIRLEGMAKVRPEERFRFFARDVERPLLWLDAHWPQVEARLR
ncbi:MAG: phosphotransferase [Gemmatimonadota bacterium]